MTLLTELVIVAWPAPIFVPLFKLQKSALQGLAASVLSVLQADIL